MPKKGNDNSSEESQEVFESGSQDERELKHPKTYTNEMLQNSVTETSEFLKLIQGSIFLNIFNVYGIKPILDQFADSLIAKDTKNIKYISLCVMIMFASSLLCTMSFFIFQFLAFYTSLRCILWLCECYDPANTTDEEPADHYVVETSANDIVEYCVVPIFLKFVLIPITYIPMPIPFVSLGLHGAIIMIGLVTMTNKVYRQKLCVFIRDLLTGKDYEYGKECEIHRIIQTVVYSIECTNLCLVNLANNPRKIMYELDHIANFKQAFKILTEGTTHHTARQRAEQRAKERKLSPKPKSNPSKSEQKKVMPDELSDLSDGLLDEDYE